ncbi:MAG: PEP-CTERM sorting domain-containing protein [Chthonomonas sp.]|nr:PEP-CTERM sorting domain-containing protein [Chthonomonas sp.]
MRFALSCVVLAAAVVSQASFELGMALRATEVYRFDAERMIPLGSFGAGRLIGARAMTTNPVLGEAYVLHGSGKGIAVFDYNTGEYKRGISLGSSSGYTHISIAANGNLLVSGAYGSTSEFAEYSATGGGLQTFRTLTTGYVGIDFIKMPNNYFYGLARRPVSTSWEYILQTYNGTALTATTVLGTTSSTDEYKGLISSGSRFNITRNTNVPSVFYTALAGGGFSTGVNWSYVFSTGPIVANAFGHGDLIYSMRNISFSTPNRYELQPWDPSIMSFVPATYLNGMPEDFVDFVTVIAPEPSSMVAVMAGAFLLLRRRRN